MGKQLPGFVQEFKSNFPQVWEAFTRLQDVCHQEGPLDEKTRRLVKLALSIGAGLEGSTHSAVRQALEVGVTAEELKHVAVLAITTIGFPSSMRGLAWIEDKLEPAGK